MRDDISFVVGTDFLSLIISNVEPVGYLYGFHRKMSINVLGPFFDFDFLTLNWMNSLYISNITIIDYVF